MNKGKTQEWVLPLGAVVLLWLLAFSMACQISSIALAGPSSGDAMLARVLGSSRVALGETFFDEADDFFHKGVGHIRKQAFTNSLFQHVVAQIKPTAHEHASGYSIREIMPWLRFATDMDPHNVSAYLTTAYWMSTALERPDLAEDILTEAQRNNPDDYRIYDGRTKLAFRQQDDKKAARLLDAGIRVWPSNEDPSDEQAIVDLGSMLSRRAFLFELNGNAEAALTLYRKAIRLVPKSRALVEHVAALERGEDFTEADRKTWESVFGGIKGDASEDADEHAHGTPDAGPRCLHDTY